jgi:hypothetical protein
MLDRNKQIEQQGQQIVAGGVTLDGQNWRFASELTQETLQKYNGGKCICNIFYPSEGGFSKEGILGNIAISPGTQYNEKRITFEGWITKSALDNEPKELPEDFRSRRFDFKENILVHTPRTSTTTIDASTWEYPRHGLTVNANSYEVKVNSDPTQIGWHFQESDVEIDGATHSVLFLRHPAGRDCPERNSPILLISPREEQLSSEARVDVQQSFIDLEAPAAGGREIIAYLDREKELATEPVEVVLPVQLPEKTQTNVASPPTQEEINVVVRALNQDIQKYPDAERWTYPVFDLDLKSDKRAREPVAEAVVKLFNEQDGYVARIGSLALNMKFYIVVERQTEGTAS